MLFLRKARAVSAMLKQGEVNPAWMLRSVQHDGMRMANLTLLSLFLQN
jgi:hypothetical protein